MADEVEGGERGVPRSSGLMIYCTRFFEITSGTEEKNETRDTARRMKIQSEMQILHSDCLSSIIRVSCLQGTANYNLSLYGVEQ